MRKIDSDEIKKIVAEALNEIVVPIIEEIDKKTDRMEMSMATKEDIDRLERKFDAQQKRLDRHGI